MHRSLKTISLTLAAIVLLPTGRLSAQLVPGTGVKLTNAGDDFEGEDWEYYMYSPKSSHEQDEKVRTPSGRSKNGRFFESAKRGQPDVIRRVPTPPDGLPGSMGSLFMASRQTGIPGRPSREMQQDDLIVNMRGVGGDIPVMRGPSCVVRVYLPPFEKWEDRTGTSLGIRAELMGNKGGWLDKDEQYWPGFFIWFRSETDRRHNQDGAHIIVRAGPSGHDLRGPEITETGWWTFGMSFTADGRVHFYASPGVDDLTQADHITSQYSYGFRCERFQTLFFNVANWDDGHTWSTGWVIDDPELYVLHPLHRAARR